MANTAFNHDPALTVAASNTTAGAAVKWVASKNLGESLIILDSGGNGRIGLAGDLDLITLTTDTVTVAGTVAATTLTGAGSGITALAAGNIASGTIATARLGSGTANNSVFLRGDNTWAAAGATDIGARVYKTVGQNTSNDTVTTVTWNAESYDTDNIHDNSTNNERLTCRTAGKYMVFARVVFAADAVGGRGIRLKINNANQFDFIQGPGSAHLSSGIHYSEIRELSVNDYLEIQCFQSYGSTLSIKGDEFSVFGIQKIA